MTPLEELHSRANAKRNQLAGMGIHLSHNEALTRVRDEDPSLSFRANAQGARLTREFANETMPPTLKKLSQAEASAGRKRRAAVYETARENIHRRMRTKGTAYDVEYANEQRQNVEFANALAESGASDGRTGAYTPPMAPGGTPPSNRNANGVLQTDIEDLQLPWDATPDEADWAKSASSLDPQKIWDAVVKGIMRTKGFQQEGANGFAAGRFQKLARSITAASPTMHSSQGTSRAA